MTPPARRDLTRIWLGAANRQAVAKAANHIDRTLRDDPLREATPFFGRWAMITPPLGVVFDLDEDDCKVEITQIWTS